MGNGIRVIMAAIAVGLSGCTFQGTLDAMVAPDRQAEIIRTARTLCSSPQALQPEFAPDIWTQSEPRLAQLPGQCPAQANGIWQLTTFNFNTSAAPGAPTDRREYALVVAGDSDGPWSEIQLNYQQLDQGPRRIVGWTVARTATRPASLAFIDRYNQMRWWGFGGVVLAFSALLAALLWFRRRQTQGKGWTDA